MNKLQLTSAKTALVALSLLVCFSFAQETDLLNRQKAVISALDSMEENAIGFSLNGYAKGGLTSSILKSDALDGTNSEHLAFSDLLLSISVRPSNETKATFDLRFHNDWQSAYREGNNSPTIRWWSYDGNILDKKLKFNLGTMRIAYTPLTIYLPEPNLIMEPEVFSNLKKEAMEERYLDGTNRRLLQGLNLEYRDSIGVIDNILLQGTIARLRKTPNSTDRIFYDFDPNKDRFSTAARFGVETFGFHLGVSDVYTFNRFKSAIKDSASGYENTMDYEKNNVLSFELNYNSKKLLSGPLSFGAGAEYALSNWKHYREEPITVTETSLVVGGTDNLIPSYTPPSGDNADNTSLDSINRYPYYTTTSVTKYQIIKVEDQSNQGALLANAFVKYKHSLFDAKVTGRFLNVDKNFESELAASPAYLPNLPIFNSNASLDPDNVLSTAFEQFRSSSLENMYYSLYYSLPMNAITILAGSRGTPDYIFSQPGAFEGNLYESGNLYNNYKFSQYYRNSYTQQTYTRLERNSDDMLSRLDPSVNLALPYGYATPDRKGGEADLNVFIMKSIDVRGVFGIYSSGDGVDYTRFGGGVEVDIASLAGLGRVLVISGSYEQNKEENGIYDPQTDRIMAGLKVGVWRGISLIGGFQSLNKEFKTPYIEIIDKTSEILVIGGPQIKISERAEFSLLGSFLSNSISTVIADDNGKKMKLDLDKYIVSGTVTVEF